MQLLAGDFIVRVDILTLAICRGLYLGSFNYCGLGKRL